MTSGARRRRAPRDDTRHTALFVVVMILLVTALGSVAAAWFVRHDTDELKDKAEPVHQKVRELTAFEQHAERRLRELRSDARATNESLTALFAAEQAQVDASNHAVDVANQAVDHYNHAQVTDLVAAFQGAGDPALADLETKTHAAQSAADAVKRAVASVQEIASG
jgi:hypothetical protein